MVAHDVEGDGPARVAAPICNVVSVAAPFLALPAALIVSRFQQAMHVGSRFAGVDEAINTLFAFCSLGCSLPSSP